MSHVTDVVLLVGLPGSDEDERAIIEAVNAFCAPQALVYVTDAAGGSKVPQALIAVGGMNSLDNAGFLAYLRGMDWARFDVGFVQVVMQDEHDNGFGFVEIYRDNERDLPWSEARRASP